MKKHYKMMITVLMILAVILSAFGSSVSAADSDEVVDFDEPNYVEPTEGKLICQATLDDDFAPDEVIVLMSTEASLQFKDYTVDDFSELDLESVRDLLPASTKISRKQYEDNIEELDLYYEMYNIYTDKAERRIQATQAAATIMKNQGFHTRLILTLKESDKVAVLKAVRILEKRDDVYAAEPSYFAELIPAAEAATTESTAAATPDQVAASPRSGGAAGNTSTGNPAAVKTGADRIGLIVAGSALAAGLFLSLLNYRRKEQM
ncbi:MAG: hypothetical protein IJR57_07885 [Ruminococcus sp.]|nr:hypothetical protein [Ruminococcus sp.]